MKSINKPQHFLSESPYFSSDLFLELQENSVTQGESLGKKQDLCEQCLGSRMPDLERMTYCEVVFAKGI